jgi:hypothetical protein
LTEEPKLDLPALKLLARNLIREKQERIAELEQHSQTVFDPKWDVPRIEYWIDFLGRKNLSDVIQLRSEHWNNKSQRPWESEMLVKLKDDLLDKGMNKRKIKPYWKAIRTMYGLAGMPIEEPWPEELKQARASASSR